MIPAQFTFQPKIWTRRDIEDLLATNDRAVERAILAIYTLQTQDEQKSQETHHPYGKGFSQEHAKMFSSFAQQIQKGHSLTERQLAFCRGLSCGKARIAHYWRQLALIANSKEAARIAFSQTQISF